MERKTNRQVIREYLADHPKATRNEIAEATGRKIHYPDLTFVKRDLGLISKRVRRRKNRRVRVVTQQIKLKGGLVLLGAVLQLARQHGGIEKVKAAVDAVSLI